MASIALYDGTRWRAVIRRAGYKTRSEIFDTRRKAEVWVRSIERDMDVSAYRDPTKELKGTVRAIFEKWRDEIAPTRKGHMWDRRRVDHLLATAAWTEKRVDKLRAEDLREWRDARLKRVTAATVDRDLNLVSSIFSFAIREWGLPLRENPVHLISRPKGADKPRERRWSEVEVAKLLEAAGWGPTKRPQEGRDYVGWAVLLAIETAMRLGEICKLRGCDFHPGESYLQLTDTKNGDDRKVPLSIRAMEIVSFLVEDRATSEKIFPLVPGSLGLYFRNARKAAGLADADLTFHDCRHEATTRMSEKLPNVLELAAVTGHRSLKSLQRYYNPSPADLAAKLG